MLLILDSNEYIFALGSIRDPLCEELLDTITEYPENIFIRINWLIVSEVRNNLTPEAFKEFMLFLHKRTKIDNHSDIPFEMGSKYESLGLKPADALIAAYAEYVGAEILVSENRHFLARHSNLPFKICNAATCLKLIKASRR